MTHPGAALTPCTRPTLYFVGVTTGQSSIMKIFPRWREILGLEAAIVGYDAPLQAPAEIYRAVVRQIKTDPLARGALITTHKLDLLAATRDLFDDLDPYAELCAEISCIAKKEGRLEGYAKDPVTAKLAWEAMVEAGHWGRSGGEVLCLGGGGAALAISVCVAGFPDRADRPRRFVLIERDPARLAHLKAIHARLETDIAFEYMLNEEARQNDAFMSQLPPGSLVINATGMGKDRPGSPITAEAVFPRPGLVWELNYRGALDFLQQARRQAQARQLQIHDGWVYFLYGWSEIIAEVFQLTLTPALFESLAEAAAARR